MRKAGQAAALSSQHPLPQRVGVTVQRIVRVYLADEPGVDDQLAIQLAWTPPGVARKQPEFIHFALGPFEVFLQVEATQSAGNVMEAVGLPGRASPAPGR